MSFSKSPDNRMPQIFSFFLLNIYMELFKAVSTVPAYFKAVFIFLQKKETKKIIIWAKILLSTKKF